MTFAARISAFHSNRIFAMKTTPAECRICSEDLTEFLELNGICNECQDTTEAIRRGEFHDPDLDSRDREESRWTHATF